LDGLLYFGIDNSNTGAQLWRTDGYTWASIVADGFGNVDNTAVSSLAAFNGYLYAGLVNRNSIEIWRSQDGSEWEQVAYDESAMNPGTAGSSAMQVFEDGLFLAVENNINGLQVLWTAGGSLWIPVSLAGFGDKNNKGPYFDNGMTVFNEHLYIASNNLVMGGGVFVWRGNEMGEAVDKPSIHRGSINVSQEVTDELNETSEAHDWTFEGSAGQRVTIHCTAAPGDDTDPRINLLGPGGELLANDDDSGSGWNALIANFGLPADGTYTIRVDVWGFGTGGYTLILDEGQESDVQMLEDNNLVLNKPSTHRGSIGVGEEVADDLNEASEAHDWTFEGSAGQRVTIRCAAAPGTDTDPRLNLLGPGGQLLAEDDDSGGEWNALIPNFGLPADGTYTIKVDVWGNDTGGYILTLDEGQESDGQAPETGNLALDMPSTHRGSISVGGQVTDELNGLFEAHNWTFEGSAGQRITIRCAAAPGTDTDPRLNLLGPGGELLAEDDDGGGERTALISNFGLPAGGTYTIKIDVWRPGHYVLTLN